MPNEDDPEDDEAPVEIDSMCSARCPHCGELNVFPGFEQILVFVCHFCGEPVEVESPPIQ